MRISPESQRTATQIFLVSLDEDFHHSHLNIIIIIIKNELFYKFICFQNIITKNSYTDYLNDLKYPDDYLFLDSIPHANITGKKSSACTVKSP